MPEHRTAAPLLVPGRGMDRRTVLAGFGAAVILPASALAAGLERFRQSGAAAGPENSDWSALLKAYVRPSADGVNRVDYRAMKAEAHDALKAYVAALAAADPAVMARDNQFAYWVNLYNAVTVDVVLDHYPVRSIRDIRLGGGGLFGGGPWKKPLVTVAGVALSLDDIEHGILRPFWGDEHIHYAVNCASMGCPNLRVEAWEAGRLAAMLDAGAADYINHKRGVSVGSDGVTASKIYDWYKDDFGSQDDLFDHWRRHAGPELAGRLADARRIRRYAYDWGLNDA